LNTKKEKRGQIYLKKGDGEMKAIGGLKEAIELGITFKFPGDIDTVMAEVNKIDDLDTLMKITKAIKSANDSSEILALIK
jgi:hypothetical protein